MKQSLQLPKRQKTTNGEERRVGIEIELAGLDGEQLAKLIQKEFGGQMDFKTRFEVIISGTEFGEFVVELDSGYLKQREREFADGSENRSDWLKELESLSSDVIALAAEQFVPWEVVTPPIPFNRLTDIERLFSQIRKAGGKGTRHSLRYAFGLHLNPELPALDAQTIAAYMKAYFCLYDWICERESVDLARRVTPYIRHFDRDYIERVVDSDYWVSQGVLIDDYLAANPTRNRSLDMLPLFAHLDEPKVRSVVEDKRVKSRPTLHYRLPNCDIDNNDWNLFHPWNTWMAVEQLADDREGLDELCRLFKNDLGRLAGRIDDQWLRVSEKWLSDRYG